MKTKTLILALGCALMLVASGVDDATAGLFGRSKSKATERVQKVWRYDQMPRMQFARGKLRQDIHEGWKLDALKVHLAPECMITDDEGAATLYDGAAAMIMGPRVGNTIIAWRIDVLKAGELDRADGGPGNHVVWSDSDKRVGEGTGPN